MVQIRVMRVLVTHQIVAMPVCVRPGRRIPGGMTMRVMSIMLMKVLVLDGFVTVHGFVMFRQVQPYA